MTVCCPLSIPCCSYILSPNLSCCPEYRYFQILVVSCLGPYAWTLLNFWKKNKFSNILWFFSYFVNLGHYGTKFQNGTPLNRFLDFWIFFSAVLTIFFLFLIFCQIKFYWLLFIFLDMQTYMWGEILKCLILLQLGFFFSQTFF